VSPAISILLLVCLMSAGSSGRRLRTPIGLDRVLYREVDSPVRDSVDSDNWNVLDYPRFDQRFVLPAFRICRGAVKQPFEPAYRVTLKAHAASSDLA
jgi:hypothetical protein